MGGCEKKSGTVKKGPVSHSLALADSSEERQLRSNSCASDLLPEDRLLPGAEGVTLGGVESQSSCQIPGVFCLHCLLNL